MNTEIPYIVKLPYEAPSRVFFLIGQDSQSDRESVQLNSPFLFCYQNLDFG